MGRTIVDPVHLPSIQLTCLYEGDTDKLQRWISVHLDRWITEGIVSTYRFQEASTFRPVDMPETKLLEDYQVLLILLTPELFYDPWLTGPNGRRLVDLHKHKELFVLPIRCYELEVDLSPLRRIDSYPKYGKAILHGHKEDIVKSLDLLFEELNAPVEDYRHHLRLRAKDWEQARITNSHKAFSEFCQKYPYTSLGRQAKQKANQLAEDKLWENAYKLNTVNALFAYLKDGPLQEHRDEAIQRILRLSTDLKDQYHSAISGSDHLGLTLQYLMNSEQGIAEHPTEKKLYQQLLRCVRMAVLVTSEVKTISFWSVSYYNR